MNVSFSSSFRAPGGFLFLLSLCLTVYFTWHAIAGKRSLLQLYRAEIALEDLGKELADLRTERGALEARVVRLRAANLDMDYVDELSVSTLGYGNPSVSGASQVSLFVAQQ